MPHVINGVATNGVPSGLTVPSDGDGPGIKAADVGPAFQGLLDGTANLKSRIDVVTVATDNGARTIRSVATIAALQAATDHVDKTVAMVIANGGLYQYVAASNAAARPNLVITPTDVGGGAGRWLLLAPTDVPNGIPTLDGNSKIAAATVPNRLVAALETALNTSFATNSTSGLQDAIVVSVPNCQVGDVLVIDTNMWAIMGSSTGTYSLAVVDGGTTYQLEDGAGAIGTTAAAFRPSGLYTVLVAGTVSVKIQVVPTSAVTLTVYGNPYNSGGKRSKLRVLQYRP